MRKTSILVLTFIAATLLVIGHAQAKPGYGVCSNCHPGNGIVLRPTANAGTDQTVDGDSNVTLDGSNSSDPDDGIASYAWKQTAGTSVSLANADTAKPSFTAPSVTTTTSLSFQLTVKDKGGASDTDVCNVTVNPATLPPTNETPVADAGADQTVPAGTTVTLNGSNSTDSDGTIAKYVWKQTAGDIVTLTGVRRAKATFTAPSVTTDTSFTFRLTVTDDGGLRDNDTCIVNVTAPSANEPPVANAGRNRKVEEGTKVRLNGRGSTDPDDGIASYKWVQLTGPTVTLSNPNVAAPWFIAPQVGAKGRALTFRLTVTDHAGLRASDKCIVNVINVAAGTPPLASAGSSLLATAGETVILSGSNSVDLDGKVLGYRWRQVSGPAVTLSEPGSARTSFVVPRAAAGKRLVFSLVVTDDAGFKDSDTVVVNVE